ncbi:PPE family protein [Mycobacterium paragordonae]|jgi:PPE-repeat protein|uniref:PPE family protein n=1 Tax=Mycobacterium paragordonae TaxID=1389713 RepID=UPI0012E15F57|nr:PPE family protein [Mycobacterium paragordonae]
MTALTDFGLLPPEINSGRMYSGAGATPLLTAAAAWKDLAAELRLTTLCLSSVISGLIDQWHGTASASMGAAAIPYAAWMSATASQAEQTAVQATAAATAYETAFAATVPPPVIAANRALLTLLIGTNVLGQNTAAIAATEAQYGEMWAQDAAAMYDYAGDSAIASAVTPFTPPPEITNPAGQATQADAVAQAAGASAAANTQTALSQLQSAVPMALQSLAMPSSSASSLTSGLMDWLGFGGAGFSSPYEILNFLAGTDGSPMGAFLNNNLLNTIFSSGFYMPGNWLGTMTDLAGMGVGGEAADASVGAAEGADAAAESAGAGLEFSAARPLGSTGLPGVVSGGLGQASSVGALSVPYGWTIAAPEITLAAQTLPSGGLSVAPAIAAGAEESMLSEMALASIVGRAMSGSSIGGGPIGVTASQKRPLPIVIVRPPQSTGD